MSRGPRRIVAARQPRARRRRPARARGPAVEVAQEGSHNTAICSRSSRGQHISFLPNGNRARTCRACRASSWPAPVSGVSAASVARHGVSGSRRVVSPRLGQHMAASCKVRGLPCASAGSAEGRVPRCGLRHVLCCLPASSAGNSRVALRTAVESNARSTCGPSGVGRRTARRLRRKPIPRSDVSSLSDCTAGVRPAGPKRCQPSRSRRRVAQGATSKRAEKPALAHHERPDCRLT
jgi:hypothetical protein